MKTKNNILSVLSLFIVSLSTNISAEPSDISLETIKILGGERFWQSEVKCVDKDDSRYIEKKVDHEQWCLQLSPTACFSTKEAAANNVCADSYDDAILTSNQLNEAIISAPKAPTSTVVTPAPTRATIVSTTAQPSPSSTPVATLTTSTVSAAQTEEFIDDDDDDDDDTYFNIDELVIEKAQLESELSDVQLKKTELNRRKAELQNSISTY